jgi:hypothetical protein
MARCFFNERVIPLNVTKEKVFYLLHALSEFGFKRRCKTWNSE